MRIATSCDCDCDCSTKTLQVCGIVLRDACPVYTCDLKHVTTAPRTAGFKARDHGPATSGLLLVFIYLLLEVELLVISTRTCA